MIIKGIFFDENINKVISHFDLEIDEMVDTTTSIIELSDIDSLYDEILDDDGFTSELSKYVRGVPNNIDSLVILTHIGDLDISEFSKLQHSSKNKSLSISLISKMLNLDISDVEDTIDDFFSEHIYSAENLLYI